MLQTNSTPAEIKQKFNVSANRFGHKGMRIHLIRLVNSPPQPWPIITAPIYFFGSVAAVPNIWDAKKPDSEPRVATTAKLSQYLKAWS